MDLLRCLLINHLCLLMAWAESHSLRYHFTTDSSPGAGRPSYQAVGHVDDVQIARYDSETRRVQLLLPWMEKHINPQHWKNQTQIAQYYEGRQRQIIHDITKHFNHTNDGTNGFVLQVRFWCLLSGDDNFSGYEEFAANGANFIALDTFTSKYVPLVSNAKKLADVWNSRKSSAEKQKWYMEQECKTWFKICLHHMKETLKPVRPEVKVWGHRQPDGMTKLQCLVYGFHPQAVDVKWVKNGKGQVPSEVMTPILPHPDGTYRIRVTVEVPTGEEDIYACRVDHSSLEEMLFVNLTALHVAAESNMREPTSGHIGVYISIFFILSVICGFVIVMKKCFSGLGTFCYNEKEVPVMNS
ncbi:class I histocompatibility antigen, Non-RT1.A alpha-1 chain-like [Mantella aurantiaca]